MPDHIAMSAETTLPAGIDPAAWFVPMAALGAGLARVVLVLQDQSYPFCLGFVRDIGPDFAVIPLADFLIALAPEVDAIGNVPDIPKHDSPCLGRHSHRDDSTADFVFQVADDTLVLGFQSGLRAEKMLIPPRSFACLGDGCGERGQALGMALAGCASFTAPNDGGFMAIAHHSGMDFAQIDADGVGTRSGFRLCPVFNDHMPRIASGFLVVDQSHCQHTHHIDKGARQPECDGRVPFASRERKHRALFLDRRVLPDGGTEAFAPVGEFRVGVSGLAQCPCGATGGVEALLRGVDGVSLQRFDGQAEIAPACPRFFREPVPLVAHHAPVAHQHTGIDSAAGEIEGIGDGTRKRAREDMGTDHPRVPSAPQCSAE